MASSKTNQRGYRSLALLEQKGASIVHGPSQVRAQESTFGRTLRKQAIERPNGLFVESHHQNRSLTYSEADDRTDNLARGLSVALGVKKGDRVAIMAGNEIEYIEVFFACTKLGAFCTLTNYAYNEQEMHSVLSSIGASVLITLPFFGRYDYRPWLPRLKLNIPSLKHTILFHDDQRQREEAVHYEDIIAAGSKSTLDLLGVEKTLNAGEVINLQFTSGSTGMPKASALTHRGLLHCGRHIGDTMYLQPSDKICLPVPLFHSFGIVIGVAAALVRGASVVLCGSTFNVETTLTSVSKYKCTGIYGVTTMFAAEMNHSNFASYDLSSLRFAILSGSAVSETLMRKVWAAFGLTQTHTNWGMTEAGSIVTMTRDTDSIRQRTLTSGRLFPGFSAKIVDPTTNTVVSRGRKGEIVLRGPGVQACYYSNPRKTAESHVIPQEDGLEWFHTGDEGFISTDGFFTITGRIKDMIIRGGENISPLEIKARLAAHPSIAQSAVIGVPDEKYGEEVCAFIEARPEAEIPADDEVRSWVREKLAHFKQPKYIVWLGSRPQFQVWPKTGTGKLRKPDLRLIAARLFEPHKSRLQSNLMAETRL
ncbi:uncharacterized protein A1O9_03700 [Exophiala aquamarina CBS 119918]|uniref:Long-chain acyl-CoA synthetase n=1 Tax=Exophiala aquamarina CBS 119918 TaxID=1182545 RepID=A0A072PGJ0_9EURO|nr:uncharacterized protein A1O9_03700 [Exophiala aquamarina CBS 119918]KEF58857.1 hypothetical protein A1O9_03700 [Exophiala aquamarina CBS 119918]